MTRAEANFKLIQELITLTVKYPDQRFSQLLQNYGFIKPHRAVKDPGRIEWQNEFYLEGEDLLKRVKQRIEDMEITIQQLKDEE